MKEFKVVNGKKFEIMKPIEKPTLKDRRDLHDCYEKPSTAKERIFWEWRHYVSASFKVFSNFGIESYNGFMFTLGWSTPEGEYYVTKTRQEFYPYK